MELRAVVNGPYVEVTTPFLDRHNDDPLQNRSKRVRHNRSGSRVLFGEIVHPV
jgi:hypothetical protein